MTKSTDSTSNTPISTHRQAHTQKFLQDFAYSPAYMKSLAEKVSKEIDRSYVAHKDDPFAVYDSTTSDFRSLDTCVVNVPSGQEKGVYYGIDIGGTNLRIVRCSMSGAGNSAIDADKYNIASHDVGLPKGLLDKKASASMLFDFIADACKKMLERCGDQDDWVSIGFTFSFAIQMVLIDRAIVTSLSKGFETGSKTVDPLVGQDCVAMMNHALKRKHVKAIVSGCLNDTTGTLLTAAYEAGKHPELPPVKIGMIVGTGFNTAVADDKALGYGYQGSLINLESGGLTCRDHLVDLMLDMESSNKKEQNAEKKISGAYLAEVARLSYIFCLQSEAPPKMYRKGSLQTWDIADIFNSYEDEEKCIEVTKATLKKVFEWDTSDAICRLVADITHAVWNRSAAVVAAIIAGCAEQTGRLRMSMGGLTVGVDGSVYCLNPLYQKQIRKHLKAILGSRHELCHIIETADGSGKGAAMLACANPVDFSRM